MPACSRLWSFLSLDVGFKFQSCANGLSGCSKTSRDASKDHYNAFQCKTGGVVWMSGMWGNGIWMRPEISLSHWSVILDISPSTDSSFFLFFWWYKIYFPSWPALPQKWQVINTPAVHPTKSRGNASKKVDYLPFLLPPLFGNTWDCIRCKTAKRGDVKISKRTWRNW
jgi:hypothetical protein